jgi:hypothetical protein
VYDHFCDVTGKKISYSDYKKVQDILVDKKLIPTAKSVYPLDTGSDEEVIRDAKDAIDKLNSDLSEVRPKQKPDHERIFAALFAVGMTEIAAKSQRKVLQDENGFPVLAGGRLYYYKHTWDYAFIAKLINQHGADKIVKTLFELSLHDAVDRLYKQHQLGNKSFRQRKKLLVRYFMGALSNGAEDALNERTPL